MALTWDPYKNAWVDLTNPSQSPMSTTSGSTFTRTPPVDPTGPRLPPTPNDQPGLGPGTRPPQTDVPPATQPPTYQPSATPGGATLPIGPPAPFTMPLPTLPDTPVFTPPGYTPPPAFVPGQFQAPTLAEAENAPGFKFQEQQGENALQNWAAAQGTLNNSSTADALQQYGQGAAQSDYANVWNQDLQQFQTNEAGRATAYNTNYQTQYTDPYAIAFQGAQAAFAPKMTGYTTQVNQEQQNWQDAYNAWLAQQQLYQNEQSIAITAG